MPRSTKIVATLGPASQQARCARAMLRAGVDVVRLNFSHGTAQDHIDRATLVREVARAARPRSRDHGRPAGTEDPRRQVRRRQDRRSSPARRSSSTPTCERGDSDARRPRLQGAAARRAARATMLLLNDGLIVLDVESVRRRRSARPRVIARRRAVEQQGHQPAGRRPDRAGADRQGHGRHQDRDELQADYLAVSFPEERRPTCTWRASLHARCRAATSRC